MTSIVLCAEYFVRLHVGVDDAASTRRRASAQPQWVTKRDAEQQATVPHPSSVFCLISSKQRLCFRMAFPFSPCQRNWDLLLCHGCKVLIAVLTANYFHSKMCLFFFFSFLLLVLKVFFCQLHRFLIAKALSFVQTSAVQLGSPVV